MNTSYSLLMAFAVVAMCSCDNGSESRVDDPVLQQDSVGEVLATVDGEPIYDSDLQSILIDMFGEYRALQMDEASRKRALDSLITSHLLAKQALASLPQERIAEIESKTRRHRENLLVNAYMLTKIDTTPLSDVAVREYYKNNLEKFGKATVKQYQLLTTRSELPEERREQYLSLVAGARTAGNLADIKSVLEQNGFDVQLTSAELDKTIVDQRLYRFVTAQPVNALSELSFIGGRPYLVNVQSQKTIPAKPLAQVSDTIRKSLMLQRLKDAIKQHSAEVLANSSVEYRD